MIFDVPTTIESLSAGLTLEPGDIVATGTPDGVGFARTPPEWLVPGDVVEVEVEGVGVLSNRVVDRWA
jgi:2-keto-4-pentenoate hydratase/2-oxohepta-3-ene-1,7-dioic acid hydratase in catechol pathway